MTISVKSRKAKARNLQKWVANKIGQLLDLEVGKDCLIESREMGQSGVDIKLYGEALEKFPFSIECKSCETWSVPAFIRQAKSNIKKGTDWLLVIKRKEFKNPVVILDANTFFNILSEKNLNKIEIENEDNIK